MIVVFICIGDNNDYKPYDNIAVCNHSYIYHGQTAMHVLIVYSMCINISIGVCISGLSEGPAGG